MNKEQHYDKSIAPLMAKIIATCQKHGIAMFASFAIPTPEDEGLRCTTHLPDGEGKFSEEYAECYRAVRGGGCSSPLMITTTHADGSKKITAVL